MTARTVTADRLRQRARQWFDAELGRCRRAHGRRWPELEAWVTDYLAAELRERLARWKGRHGQT